MSGHLISLSNFKKISALGTGTLGKSYLTQEKSSHSLFVVKTTSEFSAEADRLIPELEKLASVQHPCLLSLTGYSLPNPAKKKPLAISLPHCQDGSLASIIESKRPLSKVCRLKILIGVAEAVRYLHELSIGHR
jgi:serine/threonine protein kinase